MRIGMMADMYKTQVSGVTNSITLSKRCLENMGHEVYIFTFGDSEVIDNEKNNKEKKDKYLDDILDSEEK